MARIVLENVSFHYPIFEMGARSLKVSLFSQMSGGTVGTNAGVVNVQALKDISFELQDRKTHITHHAVLAQADAYAGSNPLYAGARKPAAILEAACRVHGRRKFFEVAEIARRRSRSAHRRRPAGGCGATRCGFSALG